MRIVQVEKQRRWAGQTHRTFLVSAEFLRRGHDVRLVCAPGSDIAKRAQEAGIPVIMLPMKGWRLYLSALRLGWRLRREGTDLLHAHGSRDHLLAVIARALSRRVPVIRTKHNLTPVRRASFYRRFTTHLIAVSGATREVLLAAGVPDARIDVVRKGLELDRLNPGPKNAAVMKEYRLRPTDFVIGTAGRLGSKSKGTATLLRAARLVVAKAPNARFFLAGRPSPEMAAMARSEGVASRVIFPGFREDIASMLSVMDLYVQPSERDALPTSVLEAMAMAKPVVATRVGGIPEAVIDGETGRLCERGDPQGLADAILALMADRELLRRMGEKGRERIESAFTVKEMIARTERAYRLCLDGT